MTKILRAIKKLSMPSSATSTSLPSLLDWSTCIWRWCHTWLCKQCCRPKVFPKQ